MYQNAAASVKFLGSPASAQLARRLPASRVLASASSRLRTFCNVASRESSPARIVHASNVFSHTGFCFSPEREALQALVTETQRDVTGVVRLKLYKGNVIVAGRKSPKSLYDPEIATMEGHASAYDQSDATGFIRLNALRLKLRAALKGRGD